MKQKRRQPKTIQFSIKFHKQSTHWVSVILHPTRAIMRGILTRLGHKSGNTEAACWQATKPTKDNCIAEIHFHRQRLSLETIVHECCHAAYHRAVALGVPKEADNFQEWVATDTGILTDACVALFDRHRVKVIYRIVKRRMI